MSKKQEVTQKCSNSQRGVQLSAVQLNLCLADCVQPDIVAKWKQS